MRVQVRRGIGVMLLVLALSWITAYSATIDVPVSRVDEDRFIADPNQMKPDVCGGIVLTNIVVASGGFAFGTDQNDLILGTGGSDLLFGQGGDDCILAGSGVDFLFGGPGNDVLVGHPGSLDFCFGGSGSDTLYNCDP